MNISLHIMNVPLHNYINNILTDYKLNNPVDNILPRPAIYYYDKAHIYLSNDSSETTISGFSFRYPSSSCYYIVFNASDFSQFYFVSNDNDLDFHKVIDIIPLNIDIPNFSLIDLYNYLSSTIDKLQIFQ